MVKNKTKEPPLPKEVFGWVLREKLGEGGFGYVYSATHADTGKIGAVKITRLQKSKSIVGEHRQLRHLEEEKRKEFSIYERIAGKEGIPEIYLWSNMGEWTVLIMELLSVDLMALLRFCGGKFTLQTTLRICDQMLHRLEQMHKQGVIHNDIKPLNFVIGEGERGDVVYLIDFGLATLLHENKDGEFEQTVGLFQKAVGTRTFWSTRLHQGAAQSYRDDLEAVVYCLIFFLRGELPWSRIMQPKKAEEMKLKTSIEAICQDVPSEFYKLLKMCREKMPMKTMPDYDAIRQTFRALSRQQGFAEDGEWDWTKCAFEDRERFQGSLDFRHAENSKSVLMALDKVLVSEQERARYWIVRENPEAMLGFKSEEDARSAKAVLMTIALSQSAEDNRARAVVRFKKHDPVFEISVPPYYESACKEQDSIFGDGSDKFMMKASSFSEV